MWQGLSIIAGFFLRQVVIKGVFLIALYAAMALFIPMVANYVSSFVSVSALNSAFSAVPAGAWYFFDLFRFDFGLPLILSASVTKFLIRRIPIIG